MRKRLFFLFVFTTLSEAVFSSLEGEKPPLVEPKGIIIAQEEGFLPIDDQEEDCLKEQGCECAECVVASCFLGGLRCLEFPGLWALLGLI